MNQNELLPIFYLFTMAGIPAWQENLNAAIAPLLYGVLLKIKIFDCS